MSFDGFSEPLSSPAGSPGRRQGPPVLKLETLKNPPPAFPPASASASTDAINRYLQTEEGQAAILDVQARYEQNALLFQALKERKVEKHDTSLQPVLYAAKQKEAKLAIDAIRSVEFPSVSELKSQVIEPKLQFEKRVLRFCSKMLYSKGQSKELSDRDKKDITKIIALFSETPIPSKKISQALEAFFQSRSATICNTLLSNECQALAREYIACVRSETHFTFSKGQFFKALDDFIDILHHEVSKPIDHAVTYKLLKALFRTMLTNELYSLCKTDESIKFIKLIHSLSFAFFSGLDLHETFSDYSKKVLEAAQIKNTESLRQTLAHASEECVKHGSLTDNRAPGFITRLFTAVDDAYNTFCSGVDPKFILQSFSQDPTHLSGTLYTEHYKVKDTQCKAESIMSGSVAHDGQVTPKFIALLQHIENSQFNDAEPYAPISYVNLQKKVDPKEGEDTDAIMKLNDEYPLSFSGITISEETLQKQLGKKAFSASIKSDIVKIFESDETFTLQKPGFYLPEKRKREWLSKIKTIVEKSYTLIETKNFSDDEKKETLFELIKLGLVRYQELSTLTKEYKQVFFVRACAACVDRGGKLHELFLYAKGASKENIVGSWFSRAALAKGRLPLPEKLEKFGILTDVVSQSELACFLKEIDSLVKTKPKLT